MAVVVSASALCACGHHAVCHVYRALPDEGWQKQDTLMFPIAVPDSQTTCRLYVEVRNHAAYPYRDLRLGLAVYRPDSTLLSSDTLCLMLADEQGAWLGTGLNSLYQTEFPAGTLPVDRAGTYRIGIAHAFPQPVLQGIADIGIRVER